MYPNLFRTVPSDESLAPALATVMQYYGWRTLSILTEQQTQFLEVTNDMQYIPLYGIVHVARALFYFVQLLQLLGVALSAASILIEDSVQFNIRNLSEAVETIFVRCAARFSRPYP